MLNTPSINSVLTILNILSINVNSGNKTSQIMNKGVNELDCFKFTRLNYD